MQRTLTALFALTTLFIAACGSSPTAAPPTIAPTLEPVPTQEIITEDDGAGDLILGEAGEGLFAVTLSGAVDELLAGSGSYACVSEQHVVALTTETGSISFNIPEATTPGEYSLGTDDTAIGSMLTFNNTAYNNDVFGVLTLAALPGAENDPISGSFDMNYTNSDGENINATGQFDLIAEVACP